MTGEAGAPAELWLLGAGGHGRVVADAAAADGRWPSIAFYDDGRAPGSLVGRWPVRGDAEAFFSTLGMREGVVLERHVAVGDNRRRDELARRCESLGLRLAVVVHPAATVSPDAGLSPGCFVAAGAIVAPGAFVGTCGIVNHGASVDHDCRLGRAVHVGPGAHLGGAVEVGDRAWLGLGASIRHMLRIGSDALVGAGAVVVASVADNTQVIGNPARPMARRPHA